MNVIGWADAAFSKMRPLQPYRNSSLGVEHMLFLAAFEQHICNEFYLSHIFYCLVFSFPYHIVCACLFPLFNVLNRVQFYSRFFSLRFSNSTHCISIKGFFILNESFLSFFHDKNLIGLILSMPVWEYFPKI